MPSNDRRSWTHDALPPEAHEALASGLPASEVWSFLLGIMESRAAQRSPATLRDQWQRDRFVEPCYLDQRTLTELDKHLLAAASAFEAIELSPLAPLGVCSAVALASQNKIVSTTRGTEVVSDPTNVLALECARRLREDGSRVVRLATSHRCVRAQAIPKQPGFAAHFRMFCLASAGHERESRSFLCGELAEHVAFHLAALARLEERAGYSFGVRRLRLLTAGAANRELAERVAALVLARPEAASPPKGSLPAERSSASDDERPPHRSSSPPEAPLPVEHGPLDHAYYDGIRFQLDVIAPNGAVIPLIDGGCFNWLRTLMSHGKMVYVASAMGSQVAAYLFRKAADA